MRLGDLDGDRGRSLDAAECRAARRGRRVRGWPTGPAGDRRPRRGHARPGGPDRERCRAAEVGRAGGSGPVPGTAVDENEAGGEHGRAGETGEPGRRRVISCVLEQGLGGLPNWWTARTGAADADADDGAVTGGTATDARRGRCCRRWRRRRRCWHRRVGFGGFGAAAGGGSAGGGGAGGGGVPMAGKRNCSPA